MKKFLTLILALALAFGLTVPALAFTSDDSADDSIPYELSIYLVEYDDNDLFGMVALPESDRGYAKNEIVAAVVELVVPDGENLVADGYTALVFGNVNADYNVADNSIVGGFATITSSEGDDHFAYIAADDRLARSTAGLADDETYKWLFFAKVEDDDAMLVAKLIDGTAADDFVGNNRLLTLEGDNYYVVKDTPADADGAYTIFCNVDDVNDDGVLVNADNDTYEDVIRIYVDKHHVSTGMAILDTPAGTVYPAAALLDNAFTPLGVNTDGELGIVVGATIETSGDDFDNIMDIYEDIVVDAFGMDYFLIGNYVRDSFFENLSSTDTLVAMVNIEPWTAYVTVPDNIVVDPPKTGDAASIMGFVMVALSGAGAVALKKRG